MAKYIEPIKEINNYLNKWLKKNGFECKVEYGEDFSYDDGKIRWSLMFPEKSELLFNKILQECGLNYDCDPFITAFFHELGHFETEDFHSQRTWDSYDNMCKKNELKESLTDKQYYKYYRHPIEMEATLWAVDFINENPEKVEQFWNDVKILIMNVYRYFSYKVESAME